jgi:hypothetical protein
VQARVWIQTPQATSNAWPVTTLTAASSSLSRHPPPPLSPPHTAPPPLARTTCQGWRWETPHTPYSRPRARPSRRVSTRRAAVASFSKPAPPLRAYLRAYSVLYGDSCVWPGPLLTPLYRENGGEYLPHRAGSTEPSM